MNSLRLWILILASVAFLAGFAGGVLGAERLLPARVEGGPFQDYRERLAQEFQLDEVQERDLRHVMERYHSDLEKLKNEAVEEFEDRRVDLGRACHERILKYVLTEEQRARFASMSAGHAPPGP